MGCWMIRLSQTKMGVLPHNGSLIRIRFAERFALDASFFGGDVDMQLMK